MELWKKSSLVRQDSKRDKVVQSKSKTAFERDILSRAVLLQPANLTLDPLIDLRWSKAL